MPLIIILAVIIFLSVISLIGAIIYNKFQETLIRINEAEVKIDDLLRKRFDLIDEETKIIKENIKTEKEIFECLAEIKEQKISNFEMDRKIAEAVSELKIIKEEYDILKDNDLFNKCFFELEETDELIFAYKEYYNNWITKYNLLVKKIPHNIVAKICKFKVKNFFDNKNLHDNILNDFKL